MTIFTRANAWSEGGTFTNTDLLWYAKGVGKMMGRGLDDPASWWFFAAIHGEYVDPSTAWNPDPPAFPGWGFIGGQPTVPTTPLPNKQLRNQFWNQCQHGTWYFLPWHRGYLHALEAQLRADIVSLGGPSTWALPYWDYFGGQQGAEAAIPPAFIEQHLPDGTQNPLYVTMRFGPAGDGEIYVPTPAWLTAHTGEPTPGYGDVTDECMQDDVFTGSDVKTVPPGFGGPATVFSHSGSVHGNMESNPHDLVHVYVGGQTAATYGVMADPGTAALDPIFYLHHCNIDRMWAGWNAAGNANPTTPDWLNGPAQQFVMPMPGAESWVYTPSDVQDIAKLQYSYQNPAVLPPLDASPWMKRMATLGADQPTLAIANAPTKAPSQPAELLGASAGALKLTGAGPASTSVALHSTVKAGVEKSLKWTVPTQIPDQVLLKLENVRGTHDATVLRIYVELPEQADTQAKNSRLVGSVGLFGMRRASVQDGAHAGAGLTFILDMSHVTDALFAQNKLSADQIRIDVEPAAGLASDTSVEVGRVSIYRQQF